jgi:hypothetical protein
VQDGVAPHSPSLCLKPESCLATPPTNDGASHAAPPPASNLSPADMSFAGRPLHGGRSGAVRGLLKAKLLFDVSPLLRWYVSSSV